MRFVPANKLIFWTGAVFLPLSLMIAVSPALIMPAALAAVFFIGIVIRDACLCRDVFKEIKVLCPDILRLSKEKTKEYMVKFWVKRGVFKNLKIGVPFPTGLETEKYVIFLAIPDKGQDFSVSWTLKGIKQGRYTIETCYLETRSRYGFWDVRASKTVQSEVRVYPNLIADQSELTGLFMNRDLGVHTRAQIGKGREFEHLREYLPGDSFTDIHWKSTAKRGHPVTKIFQIERTQRVYLIIDAARLSARCAGEGEGPTILEKYISSALIMGLAAERQGDHFGVLTFENKITNFLRAGSGTAHFNAVRDTLFTLTPRIVTPDFSELFTFIATRLRHRSLLVFLTNLDDPVLSEHFVKHVNLISKRHMVLVNMMKPKGAEPLFSVDGINTVDDLYTGLAGHMIWDYLFETKKLLKRQHAEMFLLDSEKMAYQMVSQYVDVKERQLI